MVIYLLWEREWHTVNVDDHLLGAYDTYEKALLAKGKLIEYVRERTDSVLSEDDILYYYNVEWYVTKETLQ